MKMAAAHVSDEILETLDAIAVARGVDRAKVIRWALLEYIERWCLSKVPTDRLEGHEQVAA